MYMNAKEMTEYVAKHDLQSGAEYDITVTCGACGAESDFAHCTAYDIGTDWVDGTHCDKCDADDFTVSRCAVLTRDGTFLEVDE